MLNFENENLIEIFFISSSESISDKTCEGSDDPDWQALPDEHAIPASSSLKLIKSFLSIEIGNRKFKMV